MGESELGWRVEGHGGTVVVAPTGRVDETTAAAFGERLVEEVIAAQAAGLQRLAIDLGGIAYMSSRGLRALTLAQRKGQELGTTIILAGANPVMREILAISRYDMVFKVFDRMEDALVA
jgi:anti-sigma B factor antagonist